MSSPPPDDTIPEARTPLYPPTTAGAVTLFPKPPATATPSASDVLRIGDFEIIKKLGEGSFGQVYLARQISLGREVALKIANAVSSGSASTSSVGWIGSTPPSGMSTPSTQNEGRFLAGLEHDHIVKVFCEFHDTDTGAHGLCLQYVPGADLGSIIRQIHGSGQKPESGTAILAALDATRRGEAGFDPAALRDREALAGDNFAQAICRIGARLAEALAFAHGHGILHCDIKPANILMTPYGRPMLADFNVAFDQVRHFAAAGGIGGTVAYMAPEHKAAAHGFAWGSVDARCDVYSLGVVLHELATGKRPPTDSEELPALDAVPREFAAVIRKSLAVVPSSRYRSANELAAALNGAWHLLAAKRALPAPGRFGRWAAQHPVTALTLAGVLPHIPASVVNIAYNAVEIDLNEQQQRVFALLVVLYNLIAYPLCVGTAGFLIWRIRRGLAELPRAPGEFVDELRGRITRLGWWVMGLGAVGWLPGGLVFPLVIDLAAGPVGCQTYAHYLVSFTLAGLIGVVFSYLVIQLVVFQVLLPHLGNPDRGHQVAIAEEVRGLTLPFGPFLMLACAVPLVGAVLLVVLADATMTLGFRLLVTGLIGLGVAGVGLAERITRRLRSLAAVWNPPSA